MTERCKDCGGEMQLGFNSWFCKDECDLRKDSPGLFGVDRSACDGVFRGMRYAKVDIGRALAVIGRRHGLLVPEDPELVKARRDFPGAELAEVEALPMNAWHDVGFAQTDSEHNKIHWEHIKPSAWPEWDRQLACSILRNLDDDDELDRATKADIDSALALLGDE